MPQLVPTIPSSQFSGDIATADGKWVTHDAWHGKFDNMRPHYYSWPNQGDAPAQDWVLWRKALSLSFCNGQERRLAIPLHSWMDEQTHLWKWFFVPAEDHLYEHLDGNWNVYVMEGGRLQWTNKRFTLTGTSNDAPSYRLRATVFSLDPDRFVLSNFGWDATTVTVNPPTSLHGAIEQLPPECHWAVKQFDSSDSGLRI
jgi:hypothetical protein